MYRKRFHWNTLLWCNAYVVDRYVLLFFLPGIHCWMTTVVVQNQYSLIVTFTLCVTEFRLSSQRGSRDFPRISPLKFFAIFSTVNSIYIFFSYKILGPTECFIHRNSAVSQRDGQQSKFTIAHTPCTYYVARVHHTSKKVVRLNKTKNIYNTAT